MSPYEKNLKVTEILNEKTGLDPTDYCGAIEAAMELVNKMDCAEAALVEMKRMFDGVWLVRFDNRGSVREYGEGLGDSLPEAIVNAFLKAHEKERE